MQPYRLPARRQPRSTALVVATVISVLLSPGLGCQRDQPTDLRIVPHDFVVPPNRRAGLLEFDALQTAVDRATVYLVKNSEPDGRFVYCRHLDRRGPVSTEYNLLRHAGAIYALGQRHDWQPNDRIPPVVRRAVLFLQDKAIRGVPDHDELSAVWSLPEVTGGDGPPVAKLGGSGLGLVALLQGETMHPGLTARAQLLAVGDFLLFMQKPDGSFFSKYVPEQGGRSDEWASLYYPGEAALGLVQLYRVSGEERFFGGALRALLYLADSRATADAVPADHWALLATAELLDYDQQAAGAPLDPAQRQKLTAHAVQICRSMLTDFQDAKESIYAQGSFNADGLTTPTATRVEGLLAALTFLPQEHDELRSAVESRCRAAVEFLLATQVPAGPAVGGVPRAAGRLRPLWGESTSSFNQRAAEIRVDYVQHAMSAWVQYLQHATPETLTEHPE